MLGPNLEYLPYIIFGVIVVALAGWIIRLELKLRRLLGGHRAATLEELIQNLTAAVDQTDEANNAIREHLLAMDARLRRSIQHVKTVRFNPFRDQGGQHSFATALLDEEGNGTVFSSLYSRDKVSVYAKPISGRASEYELTAEEQQALEA